MWRITLFLWACCAALAQYTTVTGPINTAFGPSNDLFNGRLTIDCPAFVTSGGVQAAAWRKSVTVTNGIFSEQMRPMDTAAPTVRCTVRYHPNSGADYTAYWRVPTTSPATIASFETTNAITPGIVVNLITQLYDPGGTLGDVYYRSSTGFLARLHGRRVASAGVELVLLRRSSRVAGVGVESPTLTPRCLTGRPQRQLRVRTPSSSARQITR
jgi:hypothetical protein